MDRRTRIEELRVPTDGVVLRGTLEAPGRPRALVVVATVMADGSGGVPATPSLRRCGFATLTIGLVGEREVGASRLRFDTFRLARRLEAVVDAVARRLGGREVPVGYVSEGPGTAAALLASVRDARIRAIVSWRGRPDLAEGIFERVRAPTLLLVAGKTDPVLPYNVAAAARLTGGGELAAVDRRSADPRPALRVAGRLCRDWLAQHLGATRSWSSRRRRGPAAAVRRLDAGAVA
jgi:hypothetical protein